MKRPVFSLFGRVLLFLVGISLIGNRQCYAQADLVGSIDSIAEEYVRLVLTVGLYDSTYIDAYFGPESWKPSRSNTAVTDTFPYESLHQEANQLISQLSAVDRSGLHGMILSRCANLSRQLNSVRSRIEMLHGTRMTFDEECKALFGFVEPALGDTYFLNVLKELDSLIPGKGSIGDRYRDYKAAFLVPAGKVDTAFRMALQTARENTKMHIMLPDDEAFAVEYVTDKSWGGYCRFLGNNRSSIQINTDKYYVDWSVDLACHEGYPGHHVRGILMNHFLQVVNGWIELQVYPLYSALSIIDEGCASVAVDLLYPPDKRIAFEKNVMFPLSGFEPAESERYYRIKDKIQLLRRAFNETARLYLDGLITRDSARTRLEQISLSSRAEEDLRFIEQFRSYCITYTVGEQIVKNFIGPDSVVEKKCWEKFAELQSNPTLAIDRTIR